MARHPAETVSVLTYRTGIQDANLAGNVHGGWVMKLCDDVAVIAATRMAGGRVVTAAVDAMKFRSPVKVGDVITLRATVNAAWRTSMEVGVRAEAEHVPTGEVAHTCTAYLTLVALGEDEKPVPPPALEPEIPRTSGASATPTTAAGSGSPRPANCAASAPSRDPQRALSLVRGSSQPLGVLFRPRCSHQPRAAFRGRATGACRARSSWVRSPRR